MFSEKCERLLGRGSPYTRTSTFDAMLKPDRDFGRRPIRRSGNDGRE